LIDDCELKRGLKETKVEDLSGFWDMIYFQIIELHNKFDALLTLKSNNWVETQTEPKLIKQIKKKMVSKSETSVKPLVKSSLRAQIQSLKNKKVVQSKDQNESIGEKENFKIKCSIDSAKGNDSSKMIASNKKLLEIQESNEMRSVLKRTPLLKK
jgi:disks large-associated protein 5